MLVQPVREISKWQEEKKELMSGEAGKAKPISTGKVTDGGRKWHTGSICEDR